MRDEGLEQAIGKMGGVSALARALGLSQPSVSNWERVPADRVIAVEAATGLSRETLRPDLYSAPAATDDVDLARASEYRLLGALLARAPDAATLKRIAQLRGDSTPLGMAHIVLAEAAAKTEPAALEREYFNLFVGVGRGEFLPYASYYMTGFLHERPLADVRDDFARLGLARADGRYDPEDHIASLCDAMAAICDGSVGRPEDAERFFATHLRPWAERFFAELALSDVAKFYAAVAGLGQTFFEIEMEAYALPN